MLINNFFTITTLEQTDGVILSTIKIDASHQIFEGHFPNNPITPGVVQIQLVKELLEKTFNQTLFLKEIGRCKFLAILNPNENAEILIKIDFTKEDGIIKVTADGTSKEGSQTFFKFNARYERVININ
ncbi:MAG: 3-hydroxyacyl-ACP dehydratase [Flavobacteriales bacterium CG_4_9_14_3_um_filter_32_8]|nr:MAG: 3-hydroxyacyl-ACP dehydratase [Flavobacteriales bacterium CG_4_9_14_3_um_filter_32_8]